MISFKLDIERAAYPNCFGLLWSVVLIAIPACSLPQKQMPDPMHAAASCDTSPMKPFGRAAQVPDALALTGFATFSGVVVQAETDDALQGTIVTLVSARVGTVKSPLWRVTDSKGGFTFDSVLPGSYQIRIKALAQHQDSLRVQAMAGRVDTVRFRMVAFRCGGY
jgi:hypothetical protein